METKDQANDPISDLMAAEGLTFSDAVEKLGRGVDLNFDPSRSNGKKALEAEALCLLRVGRPVRSGKSTDDVMTLSKAAKISGICRHLIIDARVVRRLGTPEELTAVEHGRVSLSTLSKMIKSGVPPENRLPVLMTGYIGGNGRRVPLRPIADCMARGLDQIDNTISAVEMLLNRREARGDPRHKEWIERLRRARTALGQIIKHL